MGFQRSIGEVVKPFLGLAPFTATAGGTGDATDEDGVLIDRQNFLSAVLSVASLPTIASAKQVTVTVRIQDTTDSTGATGWADFTKGAPGGANPAGVVYTHAVTGVGQLINVNYDLSGAKRYIRCVVNATHTATGTDTTAYAAVVTLGGENEPTL